ncbi:MAG: hypothetical protein LBG11_00470 [Bifidobacteriaceae bacterium]|jgi:hypothetical protein|nr:hypothetical protein [Bifidobacteriaceae bacterium]
MSFWHATVGATALVLTAALAGCSDASEDVATLPTPSQRVATPNQTELEATDATAGAEAMADCLAEAGIPAFADHRQDGEWEVRLDTDESYVMCSADGICGAQRGESKLSVSQLPLLPDVLPEGGYLAVGATDQSAAWAACLAQTGYAIPPPEIAIDRDEELAEKNAIIEATLTWANCARLQGLTVQDPDPPVADGWTTRPAALIDTAISVAELRTVLTACPNFDQAAHEADSAAQLRDDYDPSLRVVDPVILLDAPTWRDGDLPEQGDADWTPEREALWDELQAANRAFYETQGGLG